MATSKSAAGTADVAADRRRQILQAAVEVFAERGFHRTRVADIARRAGVAYGLIYHYFDSKDAVLQAVFESNWSVFLKVVRDLRADASRTALERLGAVVDLFLDALEVAPAIMQVVIQEISRSDRFVEEEKLEAFREGFELLAGVISDGQERGEIRRDVDPLVSAHAFLGALETVCMGLTLIPRAEGGTSPSVKPTMRALLLDGLRPLSSEDMQGATE